MYAYIKYIKYLGTYIPHYSESRVVPTTLHSAYAKKDMTKTTERLVSRGAEPDSRYCN